MIMVLDTVGQQTAEGCQGQMDNKLLVRWSEMVTTKVMGRVAYWSSGSAVCTALCQNVWGADFVGCCLCRVAGCGGACLVLAVAPTPVEMTSGHHSLITNYGDCTPFMGKTHFHTEVWYSEVLRMFFCSPLLWVIIHPGSLNQSGHFPLNSKTFPPFPCWN